MSRMSGYDSGYYFYICRYLENKALCEGTDGGKGREGKRAKGKGDRIGPPYILEI